MPILDNCNPTDVFRYFETICGIPHGSWNERALSDHIHSWTQSIGLESHQDELYNLIIRKPASAGYETAVPVILQGHIDMVCEKNTDMEFDFTKDALDIYVDGDDIKARGTTLGADNGIAVAMAMAILADKSLAHPTLEVVLTTVEEAGMDGAKAINGGLLNGKWFINMDSGEDDTLLVSCAGGARVFARLPASRQPLPMGDFAALEIFVGGLKGGHSGMDINKGRGNSNVILGRVLDCIQSDFYLADIGGGSKDNAIPREAWATIAVPVAAVDATKAEIAAFTKILSSEYQHSDAGLTISVQNVATPAQIYEQSAAKKAVALLLTIPNGVARMSDTLTYLVETSNNLGVVQAHEDAISFTCAVRSSVDSRKWALTRTISTICDAIGAQHEVTDGYSGWTYSPQSALREVFQRVYKQKFGNDAKILAIHAGVECGIFAEKLAGLDMISIGPNMYDVHTPEERLSISSTCKTYNLLLDVLKELK